MVSPHICLDCLSRADTYFKPELLFQIGYTLGEADSEFFIRAAASQLSQVVSIAANCTRQGIVGLVTGSNQPVNEVLRLLSAMTAIPSIIQNRIRASAARNVDAAGVVRLLQDIFPPASPATATNVTEDAGCIQAIHPSSTPHQRLSGGPVSGSGPASSEGPAPVAASMPAMASEQADGPPLTSEVSKDPAARDVLRSCPPDQILSIGGMEIWHFRYQAPMLGSTPGIRRRIVCLLYPSSTRDGGICTSVLHTLHMMLTGATAATHCFSKDGRKVLHISIAHCILLFPGLPESWTLEENEQVRPLCPCTWSTNDSS